MKHLKTYNESVKDFLKPKSNEIINKNLSKIEKIKKFLIIEDQFTIENGLMTPTLKLKRYKIIQKYKNQVEYLY